MFKSYNYFRQHNQDREIKNYKLFYKEFSNNREFGGDFSHIDHMIKNRFMDLISYMQNIVLRKQPNSILDIGCGAGMNLPLSRLFPHIRYVGLDYAEQSIKNAQSNYPEVIFKVGDAFDIPFNNNEFDLCIIASVLILYKNIDDQVKLLVEAQRVLATDGILVAVVWNSSMLLVLSIRISRVIAKILQIKLPQDFMAVHFTNREIKHLLKKSGLKLLQINNVSPEYGFLESVKYINMNKYKRVFGKSESKYKSAINQNHFVDMLVESGGPWLLLKPLYVIFRVFPSLFNMFTICVCEKSRLDCTIK